MTDDGETPLLRLGVLDAEDLAVVSAHLQDAETCLGEMAYLKAQHRFVLVVARFDWPLATKGQFVRCRTGLHFERVLHVARNGLADAAADLSLTLLAIAFFPDDPPAGTVLLTFLGGAQIRLGVECLEAEMRDIGPRWPVEAMPDKDHDRDVTPAAGQARRTAPPKP